VGASDWSATFASAAVEAMEAYDNILVPRMFTPWADVLLDEVGVSPGGSLLDVACGPGTVARVAAARLGPSGHVTACDFSPAMLAVAAAKPSLVEAADITYLECPADKLGVPDEAFDVAVCQQGLQFFPDRVGALTELRRALKPEGRAGVAVWCTIEECPPFEGVGRALGAVLGKEIETSYRNGPWGLPDGDELARLFGDAGFSGVRVSRHSLPVVFDGGAAQLLGTLPAASVAPQVAALDAQGRADLLAAAEEALKPLRRDDGGVYSELATHIVLASR
jgi:SAM-dependent methyltransferase